jgi:hypothetical protein
MNAFVATTNLGVALAMLALAYCTAQRHEAIDLVSASARQAE